jgi:IstB-like ATP binding protein
VRWVLHHAEAEPFVTRLTEGERTELEARCRKYTTPYRDVVRARLGYVPLAETACELMFQVIADRAAVIVTTNLPFSEWSQVIPNSRLCKALIDRLTDQAHIITTGADSYRFRRTTAQRKATKS